MGIKSKVWRALKFDKGDKKDKDEAKYPVDYKLTNLSLKCPACGEMN